MFFFSQVIMLKILFFSTFFIFFCIFSRKKEQFRPFYVKSSNRSFYLLNIMIILSALVTGPLLPDQ